MKRLITSAVIAVPLVLAVFVTQANAGITIRLGEPRGIYRQNDRQNDRNYRQDRYNPRYGNVYTVPGRNIRVIERNQGRRIWVPDQWNNNNYRRVWVPGHYIYQ
jgi:hypothetical protein